MLVLMYSLIMVVQVTGKINCS